MRDSMIIAQPQKLSLLLSIIYVITCFLTTTIVSNPEGITLNLIHRDSIYPHTNAPDSKQTSYHQKQVGKLKSIASAFVVEYYIGTPGIHQYAILDTGSSFPVVLCTRPTVGRRRLSDLYNESRSTSYTPSKFYLDYCGRIPGHRRDAQNRCEYNIQYKDSTRSKGHIGFETISFSDGGHRNQSSIITNVLFGCATEHYNPTLYRDGIFGIGGLLPLSILKETQMKRFSFCFGSIYDPSNRYNHVALGSDARLEGISVPYVPSVGGRFGVALNSITIGSTRLDFHNFIVYIDSGSTISYFDTNIYNAIKSEVSKIIGTRMRRKNSSMFREGLCYEVTNIWRAFPNVTIQSGGLNVLVLNIDEMFIRLDDAFCLAIKPSVGYSLIGAIQMQHHNVGFDLTSTKVYFQRKSTCNRNLIQ